MEVFTGIIEEIGKVVTVQHGQKSSRLSIQGDVIFDDVKIGDSIAVNGVCLTVCSIQNRVFSADVMAETLNRSTLGELRTGSFVNLERAMLANGRFGGHIVSGHIDGTGTVTDIKKDDNAVWLTISTSEKVIKYIVEKGSVAIDGISLTVADVQDSNFRVSIIPHTGNSTTLLQKKSGQKVNLENDIVGKYIERFLTFKQPNNTNKSKITMEFLTNAGF